MASGATLGADVCPTEDALGALLEYLVDPKLPAKSSARVAPSQEDQESVAKQVHAVVLLYNYHYRKQQPKLEFLGFESFCKLVVVLKPNLMAHMRLMQKSNDTESLELSLTEKKIMAACDICKSLDASKKVPIMEGWPVSKIAVFLVDSKKENCLLQFGSITEGVWSLVERDVDVPNSNLESAVDSSHVYKKKRVVRKSLKDKTITDEFSFQQLAFSAVKEAAGGSINQADLMVLENHVAYSMSKEKSAVRFYIMQCTQPNSDVIKTPIKNVINSLQGPLVIKHSGWWMHAPAVEYFHLLPYVEVLSDWLSRMELSFCVQGQKMDSETTMVDSPNKVEEPCEPATIFDGSHLRGCVVENLGSKTSLGSLGQNDINGDSGSKVASDLPKHNVITEHSASKMASDLPKHNAITGHPGSMVPSDLLNPNAFDGDLGNEIISDLPKQIDKDECYIVDMSDDFDGSLNMEVDDSALVHTQEKDRQNVHEVKPDNHRKMTNSLHQNEMVGSMVSLGFTEGEGGNAADGKNCNSVSSDQDTSGHTLDISQSKTEVLDKLRAIIASKDKELSQAAVKIILRKRDKLSYQQRDIEDQIAQCDRDIQTIVNGGKDGFTLKIESIIEGCTEICVRGVDRGRDDQHDVGQCSPHCAKRKRPSDSVFNMQSPCKELDAVCFENHWILPTYHVWSQNGGFQANVALKTDNFDQNIVGDVRPSAREAREAAAAKMLAELS